MIPRFAELKSAYQAGKDDGREAKPVSRTYLTQDLELKLRQAYAKGLVRGRQATASE